MRPGSGMSLDDANKVLKLFQTLLTKEKKCPVDPKDASLNDLIECVHPDNAVERIAYRRAVSINMKSAFL